METGKWFNDLVSWCNINNGFLTGLFSFLALIVSVTAIVGFHIGSDLNYHRRLILHFTECQIVIISNQAQLVYL